MAERPRFAPWIPENAKIAPIALGGGLCTTYFRHRLHHGTRAVLHIQKIEIETTTNNPGKHKRTHIQTPWTTIPGPDQRHYVLDDEGNFKIPDS